MEEQRKRAYRYLLYHAMLDIRPIAHESMGFLKPFGGRRTAERIRRAGRIADWLHNLALFSAIDFERFDEDQFWAAYQHFLKRMPELARYKEVFWRELTGDGHLKSE